MKYKNNEVEYFMNRVIELAKAANLLLLCWEDLEPEDSDKAAVGYPFHEDFGDLVCNINDWRWKLEGAFKGDYEFYPAPRVKELIEILEHFNPDAFVELRSIHSPEKMVNVIKRVSHQDNVEVQPIIYGTF